MTEASLNMFKVLRLLTVFRTHSGLASDIWEVSGVLKRLEAGVLRLESID